MYKADPTAYCGYNAGYGIPDQVKSAAGHADTVRINFTTPVNPTWLLDNYLSQITPMPDRWDRILEFAGLDAARSGALRRREHRRRVQRGSELPDEDRARRPRRSPVPSGKGGDDGPWRLSAFDATGDATFQPNTKYRGPQRAQVRFVKEIAYTTIQGEEQRSAQQQTLDRLHRPERPGERGAGAPASLGPNWVRAWRRTIRIVTGTSPWSFNYAAFNFTSSDPNGAAIDQLYIRQALQYAVDQRSLIESVDKGYGSTIDSPLPPEHAVDAQPSRSSIPYPVQLRRRAHPP